MSYLKRGWQQTIASIKNHKALFIIIVLLQILFLVSSLSLTTYYQLKLLEDAKGVIEPLQTANYNPDQIQEGVPFTEDFSGIYNSYNSLLQHFKEFMVLSLLLFFFLNAWIWTLSRWLLEEKISWKQKPKKAFLFWLKMVASGAVIIGPFLLGSYVLLLWSLRTTASMEHLIIIIKILAAASLLAYYFLLTAFTAANQTSWKKFVKNFVALSIFNISKTAVVFGMILASFALSALLLSGAIWFGRSVTLLLVTGALMIAVMAINRVFWIASLSEIEHETNHH